jgi:murein DD-endopeptidase MepM/ murein hydrolase activator NlpD
VQRERWALSQLSGAQERLERAAVQLNRTASALTRAQHAVRNATQVLQGVTARLTVHEDLMGARIRVLYERGSVEYLDMLLGAADFRDFIARSYLITKVIEQDLALYHAVAAERQQREEVRASLAAHQEVLSQEQERWLERQRETARLAAERRRLLDRLRTERQAQEAAIRELEAESARIMDIIRKSARGGHHGPILTLRNGALLRPVAGPVTSGYGWRIHPIFGTREFHTGIDIAAPYGTPVQAAHDGIVIFNGWMRGYGMLVIIDHGAGLTTTYSHLSASLVRASDRIERGRVIGRIGSTGWSTGPHLLFEVREDGAPVDPLGKGV